MNIQSRLNIVQNQINLTEIKYQRVHGSVKLLAVSKKKSIETIKLAIVAGQYAFGENYLQEALPKIQTLRHEKLEWHFIGTLQSNKCKLAAENFHWIHSVDQEKTAHQLSKFRLANLPPLNVCIQVNINEESTKAGIAPGDLLTLAKQINALPQLRLRGLMSIPKPTDIFEEQLAAFAKLREALQKLNKQGFNLDTLSMGMSNDFIAAIAEGATIIRLGTALFGERE